jgi:parallel beta-helix repeat protein
MKAKHARPGMLHRLVHRAPGRWKSFLVVSLAVLAGAYTIGPAWPLADSKDFRLLVSPSSDRSQPVVLNGQSLTGPVYIFVRPGSIVDRVTFLVDGSWHRTEHSRPFDLNGTAADGTARSWEPEAGPHMITAEISTKGGTVKKISASLIAVAAAPASPSTTGTTVTTQPPTTTVAPTSSASPTTSTAPAPSCDGTKVAPGADIQAAIDASPAGASLCLRSGVHRLSRPLAPKSGQWLAGEPGTILNGAVQVSSWSRAGEHWVADVALPASPSAIGVCMPGYSGCKYSEAVFLDERPLWRVTSRSELGSGEFYQDYGAGKVYLGDDPSGHRVEVARTKAAVNSSVAGVTLTGLIIEKFANDAQQGAVTGGSGWVIQGNEIRLNHGAGIFTPEARGVKVLDNHIHHNGQLGISGHRTTDALYEGNELAFNNTAGFYNGDWEAGGGKWTKSANLTVRRNNVHSNKAPGLWFDIDDKNILVEGNRIHDNESDGIRYEISYHAVIRNNQITGNGFEEPTQWVDGAGIMINSASDVEITGNVVDNNFNGITLRQDDRGSGSLGPYLVENTLVQGNRVTMHRGTTGLAATTSDKSAMLERNNRFVDNDYTVVGSDTTNFAWLGSELTWAQWRQNGQDTNGTYTTP